MGEHQRARSWRETRLDGVVPTAVETLDRRRSAMRVLRDIDTLLNDDENDDHTRSHKALITKTTAGSTTRDTTQNRSTTATPGPGAYSSKTRVVDKQTHFMATFDANSGRTPRALPWKLIKRTPTTPGPGTYAVARADTVTKARVVSASFQATNSDRFPSTSARSEATQQTEKLRSLSEPSTPVSDPTAKSCRLVAYMPPTKPNYRTREQKLKVRALLAARERWTHLGFYNVSHACVERRVGAIEIVPMARQSDATKRSHPVQLRRRLRLWRQQEAIQTEPLKDQETTKGPHKKPQAWETEKEKACYKTTEQWRRAQTRELLRVKALKAKLVAAVDGNRKPGIIRPKDSSLFMVAHAMSKQLGRDVVQCRCKKLKIVNVFSAQVQKERIKSHEPGSVNQTPATESNRLSRRTGGGVVPFAKATGRDDLQADQHGVFLLGKDTDHEHESVALDLDLDHIDTLLRPRAPRAFITQRNDDDERFPMTAKVKKEHEIRSILEPKFKFVEKSVLGHRFVRFGKQLDRPEVIPTTENQLENGSEQLNLPSEFPILEKLKFCGGNHGTVDNRTMQGREDVERLDPRRQPVDVVYEPNHNITLKRAPAPVDMGKMLARASDIEVGETSDENQMLCKLRENHDEITKAMRLLSKFKRQDVGFVDMKKGQARLEKVEVEDHVGKETRASQLGLSVLSSKVRVNQTLVDMEKSLGRWREKAEGTRDLKTEPQQLVLSPKDEILSKRKRSLGLVDMKN